MKNIRHIFFDLDNTLWDHRKNAWLTIKDIFDDEKVSQKYPLQFNDFYQEYYTINEKLWAQIRDGEIDKHYLRNHRFHDTFAFFGIQDNPLAEIFENQFLDQILQYNELVNGTHEILSYLISKHYQLHILSNGFAEVTTRKTELSGIKKYFQTITSADELDIRKPNPKIYQYAIEKAGAQQENSVMIGDDWIADIEGATSFGMKAIFFDVFKDHITTDLPVIYQLSDIREFL